MSAAESLFELLDEVKYSEVKFFIAELKEEIKKELIEQFGTELKYSLQDLKEEIREEMRNEYKSKFD
jgi:FKBP-type peptidyl-prolyl cis-trans isomerase (trigger factor)